MKMSAQEAALLIKSGSNVFIQSAAAAPLQLIQAMVDRADTLRNMRIYQMHTEGPAPYAAPGMEKVFTTNCFFVGANLRKAVQEGRAQYIPISLSEIPSLFLSGAISIDCALIHVSPADEHGFCSLGVSVDIAAPALAKAKCIIAQVNPQMPRTHGAGFIHVNKIDAMVEVDTPLYEIKQDAPDIITTSIARHVASLVEDGATLQMGIGNIPNAVLQMLGDHRRLGIHSEMFSDGIIDLVNKGIITGEMKKRQRGRMVAGFVTGSNRLYRFVHNNPMIAMFNIGYTNDPDIIRQNPRVTAINSAIEVDITGQVCADSIGNKIYSGVGGQLDFMRGAALSEAGKPIIAMPSMTSRGESKIVAMLRPGAGVVTPRSLAHYIVTEHGIAYLHGKNLKERATALINIADPMHREQLQAAAWPLLSSRSASYH